MKPRRLGATGASLGSTAGSGANPAILSGGLLRYDDSDATALGKKKGADRSRRPWGRSANSNQEPGGYRESGVTILAIKLPKLSFGPGYGEAAATG